MNGGTVEGGGKENQERSLEGWNAFCSSIRPVLYKSERRQVIVRPRSYCTSFPPQRSTWPCITCCCLFPRRRPHACCCSELFCLSYYHSLQITSDQVKRSGGRQIKFHHTSVRIFDRHGLPRLDYHIHILIYLYDLMAQAFSFLLSFLF